MERIQSSYLKLQGKLVAQKIDIEDDLEKALNKLSTKEDELGDWRRDIEVQEGMIECLRASNIQKPAKIDRLKHKFCGSDKKVRHLSEEVSRGLQEKDSTLVQVEAERQVTQHTKD
ncbi:uncharacterized protein A4U43_C06F14770 [Asparagus officinalis]|uniref:Uncharacterized protein n=1 Tax=Asparagus officinalis TaxID=4686 RepID=A0A5P1EPG1_ASPOF|nr:uncharacterized protein A4U43_C06F14770 [Asparagus officinalis]